MANEYILGPNEIESLLNSPGEEYTLEYSQELLRERKERFRLDMLIYLRREYLPRLMSEVDPQDLGIHRNRNSYL